MTPGTPCPHENPTCCACPDPFCYWRSGPADHESDDHPAHLPQIGLDGKPMDDEQPAERQHAEAR